MRYLSIDPGTKRTGLAIGDDATSIVTPVGVIETTNPRQRLTLLKRAIQQEQPGMLVMGLPLNMDGSEGPAAKRSRLLAKQIEAQLGLTVKLVDERLTSVAAQDRLRDRGLTRKAKKARHDALAAAIILEDYLAAKRSSP